jgi:hypothetical protein
MSGVPEPSTRTYKTIYPTEVEESTSKKATCSNAMPTHFLQTRTSFTDGHREIFANVISRSHLSAFRGISSTGIIEINPYTE